MSHPISKEELEDKLFKALLSESMRQGNPEHEIEDESQTSKSTTSTIDNQLQQKFINEGLTINAKEVNKLVTKSIIEKIEEDAKKQKELEAKYGKELAQNKLVQILPNFSSMAQESLIRAQSKTLQSTYKETNNNQSDQKLNDYTNSFKRNVDIFMNNFTTSVAVQTKKVQNYYESLDPQPLFPIIPQQMIPTANKRQETQNMNPYSYKIRQVPFKSAPPRKK